MCPLRRPHDFDSTSALTFRTVEVCLPCCIHRMLACFDKPRLVHVEDGLLEGR